MKRNWKLGNLGWCVSGLLSLMGYRLGIQQNLEVHSKKVSFPQRGRLDSLGWDGGKSVG
jgi:hypothetical protein